MKLPTRIPKIIHQTWKTSRIPKKWLLFQDTVKALHPDWTYLLWTDADMDRFVRREYPHFYAVYAGFERPIMKADVFRYLVLNKIGGLYLDLDYEFFRPFDLNHDALVLPLNRSVATGDVADSLGNAIMASVPGHSFWSAVLDGLMHTPPQTKNYKEVVDATGPQLLTRIYNRLDQELNIHTPERMAFHPPVPECRQDYLRLKQDNSVYGLHHGWGSWKERLTWAYLSGKFDKWLAA